MSSLDTIRPTGYSGRVRYLTMQDIAEALEITPRTVRRWVATGGLPGALPGLRGERPRWDAAEVAAALRRGGYAVPAGWETGVAA